MCERYCLIQLIGQGSFGSVYFGKDIITDDAVAVKIENRSGRHLQLEHEFEVGHHHNYSPCKIYKTINNIIIFQLYRKFIHSDGVAQAIFYGVDYKSNQNVLVLELLGPSLETLFNHCDRRFTLKTVLMLFDQMIGRLEYIHEMSYIHRDVKPDNFLIGPDGSSSKLFIIDFGLSQRYMEADEYNHIPFSKGNRFVGTSRYASINVHRGFQQARRDDLESLGYVMLYFLRGTLPWMNMDGNHDRKQKNERILEKKLSTKIEDLCQQLPIEFRIYITYCRTQPFDQTPDYDHLRKIFRWVFPFFVLFNIVMILMENEKPKNGKFQNLYTF